MKVYAGIHQLDTMNIQKALNENGIKHDVIETQDGTLIVGDPPSGHQGFAMKGTYQEVVTGFSDWSKPRRDEAILNYFSHWDMDVLESFKLFTDGDREVSEPLLNLDTPDKGTMYPDILRLIKLRRYGDKNKSFQVSHELETGLEDRSNSLEMHILDLFQEKRTKYSYLARYDHLKFPIKHN